MPLRISCITLAVSVLNELLAMYNEAHLLEHYTIYSHIFA
jgi:hypothetical protein